MLRQMTLAEIPKPSEDPELARQAAILVYKEIGDNPWPDDIDIELQLAYMDSVTTVGAIAVELVVATGSLDIPEPAEPGVSNIMNLAVSAEHRHEGLGRNIMDLLEKKAEEAGVRRLQVYSSIDARGFYRQIGYEGGKRGDFVKFL